MDALAKEINGKVRSDVGAFCRLEGVLFANRLPKTRSGKILRGTIRKITNGLEYNYPATIDDPTSLDLIKSLSNQWKERTGNKNGNFSAEVQNAALSKAVSVPNGVQQQNGSPAKVASPVKVAQGGEKLPDLTTDEKKLIAKEKALKRKKAAEANFEPRVLRTRGDTKPNYKVGTAPPLTKSKSAKVGQKRQSD